MFDGEEEEGEEEEGDLLLQCTSWLDDTERQTTVSVSLCLSHFNYKCWTTTTHEAMSHHIAISFILSTFNIQNLDLYVRPTGFVKYFFSSHLAEDDVL